MHELKYKVLGKSQYTCRISDTEVKKMFFHFFLGRYIENHGVIHNNWFNTTTQEKKQYYMTQFVDDYWDNGSLPIWITAQRQVQLLNYYNLTKVSVNLKVKKIKLKM